MSEKPKLAFGYGYDPEKLRDGIHLTNCFSNPGLGENMMVCEFDPNVSYRIFGTLGPLMGYNASEYGDEIYKDETKIKNRHFVTNGEAKDVIDDINKGISKIFDKYEPATDWRIRGKI